MGFLTSRTIAPIVTTNDLVHIVITGDTSQGNPSGSSYKATIGQIGLAIGSGSTVTISGGTDISVTGIYPNFGISFTGVTSGDYLPLSGGTVSGDTQFTTGLTANTISATTYLNLPINTDIFVTGGTYSAGTSTFTNNTGGTFNVSGFYTGETSNVNTLTTGIGLSADTTTGDITVINTDPDQVVVLNDGTNINVTGLYPNFTIDVTGLTDFNTFTTGFTYQDNTFTITDNSGSTFNATFTDVTGLTVNGDLNITGTTYTNVISATTYQNLPNNVTGNYLPISGGTVTGETSFTNGLTANTISATTLTVNGVNITGDTYVTGLTFNTGNYDLTIGRNDGVSFTDSLSILASDLTVTGGTYDPNTGTATFTNNTGGTFNITGFLTGFTDTYVTGGTYSNGTATFTNTSGGTFNVSGFTQPFTGGTVSGETNFTNGLTANTISATTYQNLPLDIRVTGATYSTGTMTFTNNQNNTFSVTGLTEPFTGGSGNCITDLYTSNIHSCSPLRINPLNEGNIYFGSTSGVTIDVTNDRLGVGTKTPSEKLDISGKTKTINLQVTSGSSAGYVLTSIDSSGNTQWLPIGSSGSQLDPVISITGTTPGTNVVGDRYLISGGTGIWSGRTNQIAEYTGVSSPNWTYTIPIVDNVVFVTNTLVTYRYDGTNWIAWQGSAILQNGNSLGTAINIGSNNNQNLTFRTSGQTRVTISASTGNVGVGTTTPRQRLDVSGNTIISSGLTAQTAVFSSSSQNVLTVIGSGNSTTSPIFTVQGSSGELFGVNDSLVGSLFSVNDISGLPIVEVFSDNTTLWGSYQAPSLNTTTKVSLTAGTNTIYSIPTSAYTGAFYEYTLISTGSTGARAGQIMSIWSGTSANFTETTTTDIGTTTGVTFTVAVSGSNAVLSSSATTAGWTVKTIIRSI